ncbi:MAG TPA: hypothetical protein VEP72_08835 [Microbacterium sp.]|nr:hypothetical protein [Microbacterium sp.]
MTREGALLVMIGVVVVLVGLGVWAWLRRGKRDAGLAVPFGEIPAGAATTATASGFYVATTRHGEPLERLAIPGLGFRSRVDVTVTGQGIALDLTGQSRMFLPVARITAVELANVAIDRVVEPGGLVRVGWRAERAGGGDEIVDSYLRPQDGSARSLQNAIAGILPAPSPSSDSAPTTGTDS